jgi:signal transduction histidine kinase
MDTVLRHVGLEQDMLVAVVDADSGILLGRSRDAEQYGGRVSSQAERWRQTVPGERGVFYGRGLDGVERVVAYERLDSVPWVVFVGSPASAVDAAVGEYALRVVSLLVLPVLATVGLVARLGHTSLALAASEGEARRALVAVEVQRNQQRTLHTFVSKINGQLDRDALLAEATRELATLLGLPRVVVRRGSADDRTSEVLAVAGYVAEGEAGIRDLIAAPIRLRRGVWGLLEVGLSEKNTAAARVGFVEALAAHLAVAIEATERYENELNARMGSELALQVAQQARADAERAQAQAEQAIGLRDEFLSVAAHELKTPMTSLYGAAQLLARRIAGRAEIGAEEMPKLHRALELLNRQSARAAQLTDALLDVTRLREGKLCLEREITDLRALVEHVAAQAEAKIEGDGRLHPSVLDKVPCTLRVSSPDYPVPACVDALRVEQVLTNLVDNAVRYSPDGGEIEVSVARTCGRDGDVRLEVRDHGLGIPADKREAIFERFFQAHGEGHRSGLGLGLFISRQIVEMHGGRICVEFPEDGGTRFVVVLPCEGEGSEDGYLPRADELAGARAA